MSDYQALSNLLKSGQTDVYLQLGASSIYIRELQSLLHQLGFDVSNIWGNRKGNGVFDSNVARAVMSYGNRHSIASDGTFVSQSMLQNMLLQTPQGNHASSPDQNSNTTGSQPNQSQERLISQDLGSKLRIGDGQIEVDLFKRSPGYVFWGSVPVFSTLSYNSNLYNQLALATSTQKVIAAVSENEGKLDAINSWDGAHLSFGIFQWTLGREDSEGELPALLLKIKRQFPRAFDQLFGIYGLDIDQSTSDTHGYITLNDRRIMSSAQKEEFRRPEWAFRFWKAGQSPEVQSIQIAHAAGRLDKFYHSSSPNYAINGNPMDRIITSEFGVALLLDHHVNRPAYVKGALEQAMQRTGLRNDPTSWTNNQEQTVLEAYIQQRATFTTGSYSPMTKALERAKNLRTYAQDGSLATERGSYQAGNNPMGGGLIA